MATPSGPPGTGTGATPVPSGFRLMSSSTSRALTQRRPDASIAMSSGDMLNRCTTWSAVLVTAAAQAASVVAGAGVGVATVDGVAMVAGVGGVGVASAGLWLTALVHAASVTMVNATTNARAERRPSTDAPPPIRGPTKRPSCGRLAPPTSLRRLVVDAVGVEEARRARPGERPDHLVGRRIHNHDPAVKVIADRNTIAGQWYGDGCVVELGAAGGAV